MKLAFEIKERPMIFRPWEVCAILDGRKTQVRRPVNPQLPRYFPVAYLGTKWIWQHDETGRTTIIRCPYGQPGGDLWVKEVAWYGPQPRRVEYDAGFDDSIRENAKFYGAARRSAAKMPRWASRMTLKILKIQVQRVSEANALAAGVEAYWAWVLDFKRQGK